eukprot:363885-Chlamydomonas_euryale.AAC.32
MNTPPLPQGAILIGIAAAAFALWGARNTWPTEFLALPVLRFYEPDFSMLMAGSPSAWSAVGGRPWRAAACTCTSMHACTHARGREPQHVAGAVGGPGEQSYAFARACMQACSWQGAPACDWR